MKPCLRNILAVLLHLVSVLTSSNELETCEVGVESPWESRTLVPQGSTVYVNCTISRSEQTPVWTIYLGGTSTATQFSFPQSINLLNSRGFHQLEDIETNTTKTIRLRIDSTTSVNNETRIGCGDLSSATLIYQTYLNIYEPYAVSVTTTDDSLQSVNVTWNRLSSHNTQQRYTLSVASDNTKLRTVQSLKPFYVFTAPEDAPPCEIYNFSVTATYVGATYTGAGCSVPSPVISKTLFSLPDITGLESSITSSLEKLSTGITLTTSFDPPDTCEMYPVTNYTLEIDGPLSDNITAVTSTGSEISAGNLQENVIYTFKVRVLNAIGSIATKETVIYTTDVQRIRVVELITEDKTFRVHCDFISGSDAKGCMVVLVGEEANETMTFMKDRNVTTQTNDVQVSNPPSCYHHVVAFDIESDGTVGDLPIPGNLERSTQTQCSFDSMDTTISLTAGSNVLFDHGHVSFALLLILCSCIDFLLVCL